MINAYIPSNLDLKRILSDHPPHFKYHIDNFLYILSLITEIPSRNKDILKDNGCVPINKKKLQKRIHNYKPYFDYLEKHKIIKTDNYFVIGEVAKGYKFTDKYNTQVKAVRLTKHSLIRSINKKSSFDLDMERKYSHLQKWFNRDLTIDFPAALQCLENLLNEDIANGERNPILRHNSRYINLCKLHNREFRFNVDDTGHRLHTILTRLKRELRNQITYKGEQLVSCDYANSQLCFSLPLLDENFFSGSNFSDIIVKDNNTFGDSTPQPPPLKGRGSKAIKLTDIIGKKRLNKSLKEKTIKDILNYIMVERNTQQADNDNLTLHTKTIESVVKSWQSSGNQKLDPYLKELKKIALEMKVADTDDFTIFFREVQKGNIYSYIQIEVESKTSIRFRNRKHLKEVIFTTLFSDNRFIGQKAAEVKRIFKRLFPHVYEVFKMIKRSDSTFLPILLQNIESKILLDRVAKRISIERPDMVIYTIHDSIVSTVGNEFYVSQVMKEEMFDAIGVMPQVKFEYWRPENVEAHEGAETGLKKVASK